MRVFCKEFSADAGRVHKSSGLFRRIVSGSMAGIFLFTSVLSPATGWAKEAGPALPLPQPGTILSISEKFAPAIMRGLTVHPENPLQFDFIIDTGDKALDGQAFEEESRRLIKYFLAALTVPEKELWVNLSPYEGHRIIPEGLGVTDMGRDMLAQDYLLKQLTASLIYPEKEMGQAFWQKVYRKAYELYGTTNIPVNTFNKVWIVPDKAVVYEHDGSAFVVERHLKVMLEKDYLALRNNLGNEKFGMKDQPQDQAQELNDASSQIVREILLPAIEQEVNEGETFANLRQIYNSMILATWYKKNLRSGLLGRVYMDQNKVKGIDLEDKAVKERIYAQYLETFKKGVYNYIREDYDETTRRKVPRKYFSGGLGVGVVTEDKLEVLRGGLRALPESVSSAITRPESSRGEDRQVTIELVENSDEALWEETLGDGVTSSPIKASKVANLLMASAAALGLCVGCATLPPPKKIDYANIQIPQEEIFYYEVVKKELEKIELFLAQSQSPNTSVSSLGQLNGVQMHYEERERKRKYLINDLTWMLYYDLKYKGGEKYRSASSIAVPYLVENIDGYFVDQFEGGINYGVENLPEIQSTVGKYTLAAGIGGDSFHILQIVELIVLSDAAPKQFLPGIISFAKSNFIRKVGLLGDDLMRRTLALLAIYLMDAQALDVKGDLIALLEDKRPEVVKAAAFILVNMGFKQDISLFLELADKGKDLHKDIFRDAIEAEFLKVIFDNTGIEGINNPLRFFEKEKKIKDNMLGNVSEDLFYEGLLFKFYKETQEEGKKESVFKMTSIRQAMALVALSHHGPIVGVDYERLTRLLKTKESLISPITREILFYLEQISDNAVDSAAYFDNLENFKRQNIRQLSTLTKHEDSDIRDAAIKLLDALGEGQDKQEKTVGGVSPDLFNEGPNESLDGDFAHPSSSPISIPGSVAWYRKRLTHESAVTRKKAVETLALKGGYKDLAVVAEKLGDEDEGVRLAAATAVDILKAQKIADRDLLARTRSAVLAFVPQTSTRTLSAETAWGDRTSAEETIVVNEGELEQFIRSAGTLVNALEVDSVLINKLADVVAKLPNSVNNRYSDQISGSDLVPGNWTSEAYGPYYDLIHLLDTARRLQKILEESASASSPVSLVGALNGGLLSIAGGQEVDLSFTQPIAEAGLFNEYTIGGALALWAAFWTVKKMFYFWINHTFRGNLFALKSELSDGFFSHTEGVLWGSALSKRILRYNSKSLPYVVKMFEEYGTDDSYLGFLASLAEYFPAGLWERLAREMETNTAILFLKHLKTPYDAHFLNVRVNIKNIEDSRNAILSFLNAESSRPLSETDLLRKELFIKEYLGRKQNVEKEILFPLLFFKDSALLDAVEEVIRKQAFSPAELTEAYLAVLKRGTGLAKLRAIKRLEDLKAKDAQELLLNELATNDEAVLDAVEEALASIDVPVNKLAAGYMNAVRTGKGQAKLRAIKRLGALKAKDAQELLLNELATDDEAVLDAVEEALASIEVPENKLVDGYMNAVRTGRGQAKLRAIKRLGELNTKDAQEALLNVLLESSEFLSPRQLEEVLDEVALGKLTVTREQSLKRYADVTENLQRRYESLPNSFTRTRYIDLEPNEWNTPENQTWGRGLREAGTEEIPNEEKLIMGRILNKWRVRVEQLKKQVDLSKDNSSSSPLGGIDFNPAALDLQIKRDGNGVALPLPQQPVGNMKIEGFLPVIINITPVNIPLLLGMSQKGPAEGAASTDSPQAPADIREKVYTGREENISWLN